MTEQRDKVLVWDLPTRVFHWLLVISVSACWLTSDDDRYLYIHVFAGYATFALLLFRLGWGVFGTHHARFRTFAYEWPSVTAYLKGLLNGQAARHLGHNPVGSWAIFLIITLTLLVTIFGMLLFGGEEGHGPLSRYVTWAMGDLARPIHEFLAWALLAVVGLHLGGVIVESFWHKENLTAAMLTGYKDGGDGVGEGHVTHRGIMGVVILVAMLVFAGYFFRGYVTSTKDDPFLPFAGTQLATNDVWRSECGDCHLAYHPTLLPARSWKRMLEEQHEHFDEDLDIDEDTLAKVKKFLVDNAADNRSTEPARKIFDSIPPHESPIRITETRYWKHKHDEISAADWKKVHGHGDCAACHADAKEGTFEDAEMHLP